jgi:hypothetical protein
METWESFSTFWYSTQEKNPTRTARDLIFLSSLQSIQNCSFQQTRCRAKSRRTRTVDRMNASKYPLESCGYPIHFWYATPSQISDWTVLDFNLLAAARSQDRIDIVIWSSLFSGDVAGLSVAICYGASKSGTPTHNLVTTIESSCDGSLSRLHFWARILNQIAILTVFSTLWTLFENRQLCLTQPHRWGRLLFHCPKNLLGHPLVQNLTNLSFRASISKVGCQ